MCAAKLSGSETVVEVGPGTGILTEALLERAKKVIAIEKDDRLILQLKAHFILHPNFELIHADALKWQPPATPYHLVANIPYYITSPLIDHFIGRHAQHPAVRATILVQKEVAEKICAAPPHMNVLALHVQAFGSPKYEFTVGPKNFSPSPKVDSAVITIQRHKTPHQLPFDLIHKAFSNKRKMLRSTLGQELCEAAGIDPTRRPETLSLDEWSRFVA